jgi:hypothetical protein
MSAISDIAVCVEGIEARLEKDRLWYSGRDVSLTLRVLGRGGSITIVVPPGFSPNLGERLTLTLSRQADPA